MGARKYLFDKLLQLKDSYAVTASAAAQVGGVNQILDMGQARFEGIAVINVTALDIASTDELYGFVIQGSSSASFASNIENLGSLAIGATAARAGGAINSLIGQYELGFTNEQNDVTYRYVRLYQSIAGTTPTITASVFIAPLPGR